MSITHAKPECFELLAQDTENAVIFTDAERKIEWVNDSFTTMSGYTGEEVRGRNPSFLQGVRTDQKTASRIRMALNEGRRVKEKILNYTKLGDEYWVDLEIIPRRNERGETSGFLSISRKISSNIEIIDTAIQASLEGVIIMDSHGTIRDVNPAYCTMTGYGFSDLLGINISNFEPVESKELIASHLRTVTALGRDSFETQHLCQDGTLLDVQVTAQYDSGDDAFIVFFKDITEQKRALQKIARLTTFYRAINACNEAIIYSRSRDELFKEVCRIVVCHGHMKMAWVGKPDPSTGLVRSLTVYGEGKEYLNNIKISTKEDLPEGQGPVGTALRENRPIWVEDFSHHPMMLPWHVRAARFGWKSAAAIPFSLVSSHDEVLVFYGDKELGFGDDVRELLVRMVKNISFVLDQFDH